MSCIKKTAVEKVVASSERLVCFVFSMTCGSFYLPGKECCKNYDDSVSEMCGLKLKRWKPCLSSMKQCML